MGSHRSRVRKVMYAQPTFESIEQQYEGEAMVNPGPGLARQAIRSYDEVMPQPTAQQEVLAGGLQPIPPAHTPAPPGPTGPPGT